MMAQNSTANSTVVQSSDDDSKSGLKAEPLISRKVSTQKFELRFETSSQLLVTIKAFNDVAVKFMLKAQWKEALALYSNIITLSCQSTDPEIKRWLEIAYRQTAYAHRMICFSTLPPKKDDYHKMLESIEKALNVNGEDSSPKTLEYAAASYYLAGDTATARKYYLKLQNAKNAGCMDRLDASNGIENCDTPRYRKRIEENLYKTAHTSISCLNYHHYNSILSVYQYIIIKSIQFQSNYQQTVDIATIPTKTQS